MWLLTRFGFYSIVQQKDAATLDIRARVAADLYGLRERYLPDLSEVRAVTGQDYPYCATTNRQSFAAALAKMGAEIDYCDFREAIFAGLGQERGAVIREAWSTLHKLEMQNPSDLPRKTPAYGRRIAYGAVVINSEGKVLLREPFNHRGGHAWTFPKDQPLRAEKPEETALRAARQKAGTQARIIDQLPGVFCGDTTRTCYFLMMYESENGSDRRGSKSILWATHEEAETRIKMSSSVMSRARDLEVLSSAFSLYVQRFRQGEMSRTEIDQTESRILTCAALRFDGYRYMDRSGFDCQPSLEHYLQTGELPASPLDQLCLYFQLQRRLMKWDSAQPRTSRAWQAFRQLFLTTSTYSIPIEYHDPEYCNRWRSEFLPKLTECTALVQVLHQHTIYEGAQFAGSPDLG